LEVTGIEWYFNLVYVDKNQGKEKGLEDTVLE
jgi:hypothetical protein